MSRPIGIWGYPYIDLEEFLDLGALPAVHDEICAALPTITLEQTGATLGWMGVVAPEVGPPSYVDAMHAIRAMSREQFERFVALGDDPSAFDPDRRAEYVFGDETDHPFTPAQMRWLEYRHGVTFPWKVVTHFLSNVRWEDKNSGDGKSFSDVAEKRFPRTLALLRGLPFDEIGRCLLFGLRSFDRAPLHRDTEPDPAAPVAHSITLCAAPGKRFYLMDPERTRKWPVRTRAYWFNDMDWHGVEPAPGFQYSIRIDGVFRRDFLEALEARLRL